MSLLEHLKRDCRSIQRCDRRATSRKPHQVWSRTFRAMEPKAVQELLIACSIWLQAHYATTGGNATAGCTFHGSLSPTGMFQSLARHEGCLCHSRVMRDAILMLRWEQVPYQVYQEQAAGFKTKLAQIAAAGARFAVNSNSSLYSGDRPTPVQPGIGNAPAGDALGCSFPHMC